MRNLILSALLLASAFQTALGDTFGDYTYTVSNGAATITAYNGSATTLTIPSQFSGILVTGIGGTAFSTRTALINLTIPSTVTSISIGATSFSGCASLVNITVDPLNPSFSSDSGALYNKDKTALVIYPAGKAGDFVVPETVTTIENNAANSAVNLRSIALPTGLRSIGIGAFRSCANLASITIPNSVTSIGTAAFDSCASLTSVSIPINVTGDLDQTFRYCTKLASVSILGNITGIIGYAFDGCTSLASITIPSSVTSIGTGAFRGCLALSRIYFMGNAPVLGSNVFSGSSPTVYYLFGTTGWSSTFGGRPTSTVSTNTLNVTCDTNKGIITTTPQSSVYITGTTVTILVTPKAGYSFTSWTGDATSTSTSISLTINTDKALTANFAQDTNDNDTDGLTNFQEIVTYGSNPNLKDSNNDGIEDGKASSLGYNPMINFAAFLQDIKLNPPTGLYTTTQYSDNYTAGQQNVLSNPNTHNLYTTSQIQNMAVGDLVLTRTNGSNLVLNYDIEQSEDLQTWTTYQAYALPLTNLPTNKAFVRIKAKQ